jgi:hypothetical protein
MRTAHAKLNINVAQFNALAEDLYIALGKEGVPYRLQNKLMALLASMQRQIVKLPHPTSGALVPEAPLNGSSPVVPR